MANLVTYAKQKWEDAKTAITAARLNHMEDGINDCATQINALGDSVSQRALTYAGCSDVDALKNGSYVISNSKNAPFAYGTLIQFGSDSFDSGYITQLAMDINSKKIFARGYLEGEWSIWREL